jgi:hypothetical protein
VSGYVTKGVHSKLDGAFARFPGLLKDIVTANPELFLPVFLLLVWQASAIAVKPTTLGLALALTFVLLFYASRVLGTTLWLRRLGWVAPRQGFWLYGVIAVARRRSTAKCIAARELFRPNRGGDALSRSALMGDL